MSNLKIVISGFSLSILLCSISSMSIAAMVDSLGKMPEYNNLKSTGAGNDLLPSIHSVFNDPLDKSVFKMRLDGISDENEVVTRGAKEVSLYKNASPGVVLIVTNESIGSGVLIDNKGQILTNHHVVAGYETVAVIFKPTREGDDATDKDIRRADVLKIDEISDLALLIVANTPSQAKPLNLGDISDVDVGSDVHSIGHPTGEAWTYTRGIVSQIRRGYEWMAEDKIQHTAHVIQTQTPINPGNSGGPLLTDNGNVVGINSFKSHGEGLNFAVSVDELKTFLSREDSRFATVTTNPTQESSDNSECVSKVLGETRNAENDSTEIYYDYNCNDIPDAYFTTPDDASKGTFMSLSSNYDGDVDIMIFDGDRDGQWDLSYWDTDGDGNIDLIGYHEDGGIEPTRYENYTG